MTLKENKKKEETNQVIKEIASSTCGTGISKNAVQKSKRNMKK